MLMPPIWFHEDVDSRARTLQVRNMAVNVDRQGASGAREPHLPLPWTGHHARATRSAMKKGDHLFLVDGSGYIFRAYHALPPLARKSDGLPVGAVSGFCNMLWK